MFVLSTYFSNITYSSGTFNIILNKAKLPWAGVSGCVVIERILEEDESLLLEVDGRTNGSGMTRGGKIFPYTAAAFLQ